MAASMLQASSLAELAGIKHGFFTRAGGVSDGLYASLNGGVGSDDKPQNVAENRARMAALLDVAPDRLLTAYQIHSANVVAADTPWDRQARPRADGIVTKRPGLAIAISTADCGPILFADVEARVIGAAHAGWRGAWSGIIEATLDAMDKLGADRARVTAAIGPMIRQANYQVGNELVEHFLASDRDNARFFSPSPRAGHAQFDLAGYVAARLRGAGITRVEDLGHCTYADPATFFSFRRATHRGEVDYGRHVNAIALSER